MLDNFVQKITDKFGKSVKTPIEPIKNEMEKVVDDKVDLYSKILKLGVLIFLFVDGTRRVNKLSNNDSSSQPSQIIINNYISRKESDN